MPKFRIGQPLAMALHSHHEPSSIRIFDQRHLIISIGIGVSIALSMSLVWLFFFEKALPLGSPSWTDFGLVFVILFLGHEALHLFGFPNRGFDSNTIIGIWPEVGSPYVQYTLPMRRNQFLTSAILPFLVLSIFPFTLAANNIGPISYLSWVSVLNCIGAGSDIFIFFKLFFNVPNDAWVVENGESLLWKYDQ